MATKKAAKQLTPKQAAVEGGKVAAAEVIKHMVAGGLVEVMKAAGVEIARSAALRFEEIVERRGADVTIEAPHLGRIHADGPTGCDGGGGSGPRAMRPVHEGEAWGGGTSGPYRSGSGDGGGGSPDPRRMTRVATDRVMSPGLETRVAVESLAMAAENVRRMAREVRARLGVPHSEHPEEVEPGKTVHADEGEGLIPMLLRVMADVSMDLRRTEVALGDVLDATE